MVHTSELCSKCRYIFVGSRGIDRPLVSHHKHIQDMTKSSKERIHLKDPTQPGKITVSRRAGGVGLPNSMRSVEIYFERKGTICKTLNLTFEPLEGDETQVQKIWTGFKAVARVSAVMRICNSVIPSLKRTTSTGSIASLQQAKIWNDQCIQRHRICQQDAIKGNLSTRLVPQALRYSRSTFEYPIHDPKSPVGTKEFITLTLQNIKDFQTRIPFTDLTKTF
ncbi:hypothetical protein LARI1_G002681 [Lachnellula arida]|uniref:Uncharacterized protein n=1 Tax=Lachnellula arida TaxID=1316785 RepID=A0A8T9BHG4_9HELO|nr:hypothetical protein LARI1_G002681 [Lachnellula arida]